MAPRKKKNAPASRRTQRRSAARSAPADPPAAAAADGVTTIRKYANRRLYDTAASRHITQEELYRMVGAGHIVRVIDAATDEDITNQTLALALIEHDPAKWRLMPSLLLHQMIRLREQALGGWLSALWPAAGGAPMMPAWPGGAGAWPGAAATWPGAWPADVPTSARRERTPPAGSSDEASIEALRREVAHLLRRLSDLEGRQ